MATIEASMEPLAEERNHHIDRSALETIAAQPQWSRSLRSGITRKPSIRSASIPLPQWSRSLRSGITSDPSKPLRRCAVPQWSRSLRSGITALADDYDHITGTASMEPLAEERNHHATSRPPPTCCCASMDPPAEERT